MATDRRLGLKGLQAAGEPGPAEPSCEPSLIGKPKNGCSQVR
jgi:hypothetical protein